ncbi:MAG: hypothetical protein ACJAYD_000933 [Patiriisocius sp.]|jgi:hypothetical protein
MLVNVSYNNKQIDNKIDKEIGKPFSLSERFKLKGIGSPKLIITQTSVQIHNLLILDSNRNQCNIEMRPQGIIVGFRSLLESYALVIPYYKLVLYKGKAEEYSIYKDNYFIKIQARGKDKEIHRFIQKVLNAKVIASPERIDDL